MRHAGRAAATVVVAPGSSARETIAQAATSAGERPLLIDETEFRWERASALLAVIWLEIDQEIEGVLDTVGKLVPHCRAILCMGPGLGSLPLGERCRLLLAGASRIDDTRYDDQDGLSRKIASWIRIERHKIASEDELRESMAGCGLIGASPGMLSVFGQLRRAGELSDVPVLLTGESGTGKELLARAAHRLDPRRRAGPLVAVNCAAIQQGLAESELFGHRRGAFTGADSHRQGLFRAAEGGVLFLDEVGELDGRLQAKLLRVLQERRVVAVGEDTERSVDVRIVAATNRDLPAMVRQGSFRDDLYHRLGVVAIRVPPLRERRDDIPLLIERFVRKHHAAGPVAIAPEFTEAVIRLELRGNVRELENLVLRALLERPESNCLRLEDLPAEAWRCLAEGSGRDDSGQAVEIGEDPVRWNLRDHLARCEKLLLDRVLRMTTGSQAEAARLLGITPRSVYTKIRKHGLHTRG